MAIGAGSAVDAVGGRKGAAIASATAAGALVVRSAAVEAVGTSRVAGVVSVEKELKSIAG